MEESITEGVRVNVEAIYMETHSYPEKNRYVFAYRIRLKNFSQRTVQLLRRHWIITDSNGETNEVHGEGVVGEQPVLHPGEAFEYTSGTPLPTPSGIMAGTYQMELANGEQFDVEIPAFSLDSPYQLVKLN